jgi:hypothetical protein
MRESSVAVCVALLAVLVIGGCTQDPAGPVINNSGDNNAFAISDESNGAVDASPPAPVVVTPVVVVPEAEE